MINPQNLKQLLDLYLEFLEYLADKESISSSSTSLAKLRVAEHSFNFLLDSAVNVLLDNFNDGSLSSLGGSEGNKAIRVKRDKIAELISQKIKKLPNGQSDYNNYCDILKSKI